MKQAAAGAASATQAVKADKKPFFSQRTLSHFIDFLFVLPALILLGVFTYYPIVKLVQISFTDWNLLNDTWKYVGLKNWQWLFAGSGAKYLWNSLKVTFLYSMGEILVTMVGGMLLALLFNRMTRSFGLMRAFVFVPKYVAMSSAAVVFLWILNTDSGVLNYLLQCIGLPAVDWLNQQSTALPSVLMLTGWRVIGYGMMIYLSAMMGISQEYYEAASLDGANGVQKFFRITLPLLSPTTLFLLGHHVPVFHESFPVGGYPDVRRPRPFDGSVRLPHLPLRHGGLPDGSRGHRSRHVLPHPAGYHRADHESVRPLGHLRLVML